MEFSVLNEQTNNKQLTYVENFWTGKRSIWYDGKECIKLDKKTFKTTIDGQDFMFVLKGNSISGINVLFNSQEIVLARKLKWYEYVIAVLPLILVFFGGAIGGACGGVAFVLNLVFIRKSENIFLKILICLASAAIAVLVWFIIASAILGIL